MPTILDTPFHHIVHADYCEHCEVEVPEGQEFCDDCLEDLALSNADHADYLASLAD